MRQSSSSPALVARLAAWLAVGAVVVPFGAPPSTVEVITMSSDESPYRMQCLEIWGGNEPTEQHVSLGGLDAWVYAVPHADAAAGGDVHYLSSCATGTIARLFLADVSGHGGRVAEVGRTLRGLMRDHVNHHDQRRFVARMNRAFAEQATAGLFATAVVCSYHRPRSRLSVCNAGHPPPLWFRKSTGRWQLMESADRGERAVTTTPSNLPLGVLDATDYEQFDIRLDAGDRVLCYTDALVEARDADGEMLGARGLLDAANAVLAGAADASFLPALVTRLRERVGATLYDDDVTMVLFTPNAATRRVGFWIKAYAPIRVIAHHLTTRADGTRRFAARPG